MQTLEEGIGEVHQALTREEGRRDDLNRALEAAERRIGEASAGVRVLRERLGAIRKRLKSLKEEQTERRSSLRAERQALVANLRAAYVLGREQRLQLLLNLKAAARAERVLTYAGYLARERRRRVGAVRRALTVLERIAVEQRDLKADLGERQARLEMELGRLREAQVERQALVADLDRSLREKHARLQAMQRDAAALRLLIRRLRSQALAAVPGERPFASLRGRLPWPLRGRIVVAFGAPRAGGIRWDGVLIRAPLGREVRAVHHGRVVFADWLRGFGLLLILDHGEGYMTLYGFNQGLLKETGEWVAAGEPVALLGDSGGQRAAGLYFGIRHNGRPLDPRRWISGDR